MPAIKSLTLLTLAVGLCCQANAAPQLRFGPDGTFKIVQFTDLHAGELESADDQANQVQIAVLETEPADLVVFSGDLVSGYFYKLTNATPGWTEKLWRRLIEPVNAAGLPYAVVLGNHDVDGGGELKPREVLALDMRLSNLSLTQQGPQNISHASNYYLDIFDAAGEEVAARIWMLDSGDLGCGNVSQGWGCLETDILDWVVETSARLPSVPTALAFAHIPPPEAMELWDDYPTNGSRNVDVNCPRVATGVVGALREAGIQALHFGHDHSNDFYGVLDGVRLAYGRKTGYASIDVAPNQEHGARVILLREGESAADSETWIRKEDGQREDQPETSWDVKLASQQATCQDGLAPLFQP
ncbi:hypothetical protein N2152v2_009423 [Parachlorella kessleri]